VEDFIDELFGGVPADVVDIPLTEDTQDVDAEAADIAETLQQLAAPPTAAVMEEAFRRGHGLAPTVAHMRGADLVRFLQLPPAVINSISAAGVVPATRDGHRRLLRLLATMPTVYQAMTLSTAIVMFLEEERAKRHWRYSTRLKYQASCQGALAALPLYRKGALPIRLQDCPTWIAAMRRAAAQCRTEVPTQAKTATTAKVTAAIALCKSLPVRVAMILAWALAGRVGDVLRLRREDVVLADDGQLTATYRQHKTLLSRGPYAVKTRVTPVHMALVRQWLEQRATSVWVFPTPDALGPQVRQALRAVDPALEQRSLRRGALLTMAAAGVSEAVLLEFSGHTTGRMLRRYLGFGASLAATGMQTLAAAALLQ
jgi:integrase